MKNSDLFSMQNFIFAKQHEIWLSALIFKKANKFFSKNSINFCHYFFYKLETPSNLGNAENVVQFKSDNLKCCTKSTMFVSHRVWIVTVSKDCISVHISIICKTFCFPIHQSIFLCFYNNFPWFYLKF